MSDFFQDAAVASSAAKDTLQLEVNRLRLRNVELEAEVARLKGLLGCRGLHSAIRRNAEQITACHGLDPRHMLLIQMVRELTDG